MSDVILNLGISAVILGGAWLAVLFLGRERRPVEEPVPACRVLPPLSPEAAGRVGQLTDALARRLGCDRRAAAEAIEQELRQSPTASDAVVLQRAAYWYRRNTPDTPSPSYRDDRAPG